MKLIILKVSFVYWLLLGFLPANTHAQIERMRAGTWYFGDGYGLDFTSGTVTKKDDAQIKNIESCCTMSDKNGKLLFYTNGGGRVDDRDGYVWNAQHEVMEGGNLGSKIGGGYSSWQGCLIVPKPDDPTIYYLFTVDELETYLIKDARFPQGKGCSVLMVDIAANNGKGKVRPIPEKLLTPSFEYITGTQHGNCIDYWVIVQSAHHYIETNADALDSFYVFKVSEEGIHPPVISPIDNGVEGIRDEYGAMKMTTDGQQLLVGTYLYDFDKNTGLLSKPKDIKVAVQSARDPAVISPNNQFLYNFKVGSSGDTAFAFLGYQYDLTAADIKASEVEIANKVLEGIFVIGTPQLAPDGKIYLPSWADEPLDKEILSVIHAPNTKGVDCNFELDLLNISENYSFRFLRLANFMDHIFQNKPPSEHEENHTTLQVNCEEQEVIILQAPPDKNEYAWSTNTSLDSIAVYQSGKYWIDYATGCDSGTDTFLVDIINDQFKVALPRSKFLLCEGAELTLRPPPINDLPFEWQDGTISDTYTISQPGTYRATAKEGLCIHSDSLRIIGIRPPELDLVDDTLLCDVPLLYLQSDYSPYYNYEWSNGSTSTDFWIFEEGVYSLRVSNICGVAEDSVRVQICPQCDIYVPNAFSPNGDGLNDVLQAFKDIECAPLNFQFSILDRWGNQVYHSQDIADSWDGQSKNNQLIAGVYLYHIQYDLLWPDGSLRREIQTGDITLFK